MDIGPDHIEVGSFIGLAAVTGSELCIERAGVEHLLTRVGTDLQRSEIAGVYQLDEADFRARYVKARMMGWGIWYRPGEGVPTEVAIRFAKPPEEQARLRERRRTAEDDFKKASNELQRTLDEEIRNEEQTKTAAARPAAITAASHEIAASDTVPRTDAH